jgi:signal transduction histidine kinase
MRRVLDRLTARLVASHLLVIAVAMGLLSFLLLSLVRGYFEDAARESLLVQARLVARTVSASQPLAVTNINQALLPSASNTVQQQSQNRAPATPAPNSLALDNATLQITSQLATRVRLVDASGVVQADSFAPIAGQDLSDEPRITVALSGQEASELQAGQVLAAVPIRLEGAVSGAVYLSQPLTDVAAVLGDLRLRLAASAGVALLLSALVGLVLARAIARPVRSLTTAADRLAAGDFDYRIEVDSPEELAHLAGSFGAMRDELRRALQARTDLVSNVSHELRTPLTAIKGLTETLRDGAVDDPTARDRFLASIESQTDRLIRLVNDLLVLSRADAQALTLRVSSVDLLELAHQTVLELQPAAESRAITLSVEGASAVIRGDPDRLRQVLINLLDNAVRYSPPGGRVTLRVTPGSPRAAVAVSDDGPGIPPAELPHVFERFYRADRSRQRVDTAGGAGLGLAIARTLVEAHGGAITLDSCIGAGTTVTFTLPAV